MKRGDGDVTEGTQDRHAAVVALVDRDIVPEAGRWDRDQGLPDGIIRRLADARLLVPTLPWEAGGAALDMPAYGRVCEELGRGCASVRNLVAVQGMVAHTLLKWARPELAGRWVPRIGGGAALAAFCLTEPDTGSNARGITTVATRGHDGFVLNGRKRWISFARNAAVFLVMARLDGEMAAFLVERDTPGLSVHAQTDLLGLRASGLAEIVFEDCVVPGDHLVSHGRLTFDAVVGGALDYGRYSTACGAVGLAEACLRASLAYAGLRQQFGVAIGEHQLVAAMLTDMIVSVEAARLLCREAGRLRAAGHADAVRQTLMAKYLASRTCNRVAADAVQIHGANGCGPESPVERHLRDAKIQEIIEGTTQVHEIQIARLTLNGRSRPSGANQTAGTALPDSRSPGAPSNSR